VYRALRSTDASEIVSVALVESVSEISCVPVVLPDMLWLTLIDGEAMWVRVLNVMDSDVDSDAVSSGLGERVGSSEFDCDTV